MTHGKGIVMPKQKDHSMPYEELNTVKMIGNKVLFLRTIEALENNVVDNLDWRQRSFESFVSKLKSIAKETVGEFDMNSADIHEPIIVEIDGEKEPEKKVLVNFAALIPFNPTQGRLN